MIDRSEDMMELYREGLDDRKIAQVLGVTPYAVRKFRQIRGLKSNWNSRESRVTYRGTNLHSGNTFTGGVFLCATWMDTTPNVVRQTCCTQRQYGIVDKKRTLYAVERVAG